MISYTLSDVLEIYLYIEKSEYQNFAFLHKKWYNISVTKNGSINKKGLDI